MPQSQPLNSCSADKLYPESPVWNVARSFVGLLARLYQTTGILRLLSLATLLFFLATAFRAGWQRAETDFPNYYTAAVLLRRGEPLRKYYDWTWFARQMNYAGVERQLGAYTPQTPLTMLPMLVVASLPVQRAKQVWLTCDLVFLGAAIWILSRATRFRIEQIWLLAFCGYFSLYSNFLLGQYYVFLLFLLTLIFYLWQRRSSWGSGLVAGVTFALKLFSGPLLLYFVATRRWRAVAEMLAAIIGAGVLAIILFGWPDVQYYLTQILPRSLEGGSVNPYNPGDPTVSTMLRHWFVREPQLNPGPLWNAPWLFFFLRTFVTLTLVVFVLLGVTMRPSTYRHDFAWFLIAVLLLSTSVASYTFILLLLPVVLLLHDATPRQSWYLITTYMLLTFKLRPAWLYPKVWLLLGLFLAVGWRYWQGLSPKLVISAAATVSILALLDASRHMHHYRDEPQQHFEQIMVENKSLFSSFPVITRAGLFFQSMADDRYVIRWLHDSTMEEIALGGNALRPIGLPDASIAVEQVDRGTSRMLRFEPTTRKLLPLAMAVPTKDTDSLLSPDGHWLAFTSEDRGAQHLWLRNVAAGQQIPLTGGNCNSSWPTWELDSQSIVFASDCGRAFGLPALYRAKLTKELRQAP